MNAKPLMLDATQLAAKRARKLRQVWKPVDAVLARKLAKATTPDAKRLIREVAKRQYGELLAISNATLDLKIEKVAIRGLKTATLRDARASGYPSVEAFEDAFTLAFGRYQDDPLCWVYSLRTTGDK